MKNISISIALLALLISSCQNQETSPSEEQEESAFHTGIMWGSEDETADWLSWEGLYHWSNIEFDKAFVLWHHSLQRDSTQFAVHTMMAIMSRGDQRDIHIEMAKKHVADKNETSKKFVTLLDYLGVEGSQDKVKAIWAELHEMSNGPWIHHMYARSLNNPDNQVPMLEEIEKVIAKCEENDIPQLAAASYNIKAYMLQQTGDTEGAIAAADKYLELWRGHNSWDSRAELYLLEGDTTSAIEGYEKVLELYPFSQSARDALEVLKPAEPDADTDEVTEEAADDTSAEE